jgi:hypothetical protein
MNEVQNYSSALPVVHNTITTKHAERKNPLTCENTFYVHRHLRQIKYPIICTTKTHGR